MAIYHGSERATLYKGDYLPVNLYHGDKKVAGWKLSTKSGTALSFADTYKTPVDALTVYGKSTQVQSVWGTNLITNGDFSAVGYDLWLTYGSGNIIRNENNRLTVYTTVGYTGAQYTINTISGHIYYFAVTITGDTNDFINLNSSGGASKTMTTVGTERLSVVATANATNNYPLIRRKVDSSGTNTYADNAVLLDLTATFGAGKEPTAAQMDAMLAQYPNSWFNGKALLTTNTTTYSANSPSPDYPSSITNVGDSGGVTVSATDGATTNTITQPIILRSLPDARDEWNPVTGAVTRRVGVKVFDGTENIVAVTNDAGGVELCYMLSNTNADNFIVAATSNIAVGVPRTVLNSKTGQEGSWVACATNWIRFVNAIKTATDFKSYLAAQYAAGTPVTVLYKLATPTTEQLTPATLATTPRHCNISAGGADIAATVKVVDTTL